MRRWETLTALAAVVIASAAALPIPDRLTLSIVSVVLLALVSGSMLLRGLSQRKTRSSDAADRARRIRERRDRR
ncbi:MAG TPA: hypothetical protein VMF11_10985 [Candidatus Baltobacteraceae bacterium]|nr:hypothetical protein [Candidatus Baltobacteraceae bacterium]